jgi:hypothetical protein
MLVEFHAACSYTTFVKADDDSMGKIPGCMLQ